MFTQPHNAHVVRDLALRETLAHVEARGEQDMTPGTPFALLVERCGLSQREAAEFLKVRLDTVKTWYAGRDAAKPSVLAELRSLYAAIQVAADGLAKGNDRLLELQRERGVEPRGIVFGVAETDDVARSYGFPSLAGC